MEKQSTNSRSQASREASQQTPRSQAQKPKTMTRTRQTWEEAYSVDQNLGGGIDLGHWFNIAQIPNQKLNLESKLELNNKDYF